MRKLIRHKSTGSFLTKSGAWTPDKTGGCDFAQDPECAKALHGTPLEHAEWYYCFDHPTTEYDFSLPLWFPPHTTNGSN